MNNQEDKFVPTPKAFSHSFTRCKDGILYTAHFIDIVCFGKCLRCGHMPEWANEIKPKEKQEVEK